MDYYQLGQASAFVQPGAYRIASTSFVGAYGSGYGSDYGVTTLDDVAFRNPDGSLVLIAYNGARSAQRFNVRWGTVSFAYTLPAAAMVTFTWAPPATSG